MVPMKRLSFPSIVVIISGSSLRSHVSEDHELSIMFDYASVPRSSGRVVAKACYFFDIGSRIFLTTCKTQHIHLPSVKIAINNASPARGPLEGLPDPFLVPESETAIYSWKDLANGPISSFRGLDGMTRWTKRHRV